MSGPEETEGEPLYGRYGNPSRNSVEAVLASLEGAKFTMCFSSGMAAVNAVIETLKSGDHVVASKQLYGGVFNLFRNGLPRIGIDVSFVNCFDLVELKKSLRPATKLVWLEVCTNPLVHVLDLEQTVQVVKSYNPDIMLGVDNTFLTPYVVKPLDFGADIVMHSCSKYLGGHSDLIMGALSCNRKDIYAQLKCIQRYRGATPSPYDCSLLQRSLTTLEIRMERQCQSAFDVAKFLWPHPCIYGVSHPLLDSSPFYPLAMTQHGGKHSGMLAFQVRGGEEEAIQVLEELKLVKRAASLGGCHSLACHPCSLTHVMLTKEERNESGIMDNLIRLSVGLEEVTDIIADLDQALRKATEK